MVKKTSIHLITPLEATWECFKIWGGPKHKSLWDQKTTWTYRALQTLKQPHWERLKGCPGLLFGRKGFDLRMVFWISPDYLGSLLVILGHSWLLWVTPDYFGSLLIILDPSWLFWIPPDYFGSLLMIYQTPLIQVQYLVSKFDLYLCKKTRITSMEGEKLPLARSRPPNGYRKDSCTQNGGTVPDKAILWVGDSLTSALHTAYIGEYLHHGATWKECQTQTSLPTSSFVWALKSLPLEPAAMISQEVSK